MQPYWYVVLGIGGLALLWGLYKFWRIIVGIVVLLIIAIVVKLFFYKLGTWL